jgi:vanillate/3-O-methylgallate O-demethylase
MRPTRSSRAGFPSPLPAVYSGEKMKKYREWLPASGYEATCSIAGSFVSKNIEDYYSTPYELGYGIMVKFDHDFIGREALEKKANEPQRKKVTFAWNAEDVARVMTSILRKGDHYKYIELPLSNYGSSSFDAIVKNGKTVGLSMFSGISYNERSMLSLGVVDPDIQIGEELTLVWGEENGGTKKTTVERHKQTEIRVTVSPGACTPRSRRTYVSAPSNQAR